MFIEQNDLITLDDNNKYLVFDKVIFQEKEYYYIIDINDNKNIKFCYLENDEIVEIKNKDIITAIVKLLLDKSNINEV